VRVGPHSVSLSLLLALFSRGPVSAEGSPLGERGLVSPARADDSVLVPRPTRSPFWQTARNPEFPRIEELLRQGRARLQPAMGLGLLFGADASIHRRTGVENALARFERALSIDPQHPEALYLAGKALALWERRTPQGKVERRTREAIERFERLRQLDPLYEAGDVAFELGVLRTREEDFRGAAEAYEQALALRLREGSRSTLLGNLAEVTMMGEDLERALSLYEQALAEGSREERVLALWGMAVTLDRLGEQGESMERAKQALRDDHRPMAALRQGRVFFVPPYESHYYDGLGFRALAELTAGEGPTPRDLARDAAKVLARPEAKTSLPALKQLLLELSEAHSRPHTPEGALGPQGAQPPLVAALLPLVERALAKGGHAKPRLPGAAAPREDPAAKALLLSLQSVRSFLRYLERGGEQGPWALDARAHLEEINAWFLTTPGARAAPR
jgi:tetratricopeptide (TPR) repeat protein